MLFIYILYIKGVYSLFVYIFARLVWTVYVVGNDYATDDDDDDDDNDDGGPKLYKIYNLSHITFKIPSFFNEKLTKTIQFNKRLPS